MDVPNRGVTALQQTNLNRALVILMKSLRVLSDSGWGHTSSDSIKQRDEAAGHFLLPHHITDDKEFELIRDLLPRGYALRALGDTKRLGSSQSLVRQ